MTDAVYRILPRRSKFTVEIDRLGALSQVTSGFASQTEAEAWIRQDKHIADIDGATRPIAPPALRPA